MIFASGNSDWAVAVVLVILFIGFMRMIGAIKGNKHVKEGIRDGAFNLLGRLFK